MEMPSLNLSPEHIGALAVLLREYDNQVAVTHLDDDEVEEFGDVFRVLDADDTYTDEPLLAALTALNEDQRADVLALMRMGRGDYYIEEWDEAREMALMDIDLHTFGRQLMEEPLSCDFLEEALQMIGVSVIDVEPGA